ncbi:serine/threonine protein kinase ppk14, putative [Entamoeba invadens IP1]|uniref:non-specific serine/threonine protein kinase n=1 Tax=Entamoeba invadens IP1 TaxID=370355 RepID=A0A0A1U4C7_ENTIV|nr:serine/threonine protein kinase ppk14, putative [Entamoeba invadens IP1]ELP89072.1 serine/threonine protein kinase ppk14, putative [Entamoeba invadens IP1]|eukprot:XP_004255843.1 serine/threonine protein kinase ppk14, putative [Entamoeba invadens IP1]
MSDIKPMNPVLSSSPSGDQDLPKTVGLLDFRKVKMIGRGNVGHVYLVQLNNTSHYFAMKVRSKAAMTQQNKTDRVTTEREILKTTHHPFLTHLYWSFSTEKCFYFVMDYCAGGNFYRALRKTPHKFLPEEPARFYLAEILLALEYLHLNGIIYRDLKPENVLLNSSGHIMLSDFDLSKTEPTKENVVDVIKAAHEKFKKEPDFITNSFVGTAEYLAPEVLVGFGYSAQVDWWTFGILMYEILYGRTPFFNRNRDTVFSNILDGELMFPKTWTYPISTNAKDLMRELLQNDPEKRIGAKDGAEEIKAHNFFKGVKFQLIRNITPPIIPKISGPEDTKYFDENQTDDGYLEKELEALQKLKEEESDEKDRERKSENLTLAQILEKDKLDEKLEKTGDAIQKQNETNSEKKLQQPAQVQIILGENLEK